METGWDIDQEHPSALPCWAPLSMDGILVAGTSGSSYPSHWRMQACIGCCKVYMTCSMCSLYPAPCEQHSACPGTGAWRPQSSQQVEAKRGIPVITS